MFGTKVKWTLKLTQIDVEKITVLTSNEYI